jgi:hypothetical protein
MTSTSIILLTPDFSRVSEAIQASKPFQRFSVAREAVETAENSLGTLSTWLKPGVNGSGTSLRSALL